MKKLRKLNAALCFALAASGATAATPTAPQPRQGAAMHPTSGMVMPRPASAFKNCADISRPARRVPATRIMSAGDGTTLYGNMVMAGNWTEENKPYGIYQMTATPQPDIQSLKLGGDFKSTAGVMAGDKYYSFYYEQAWSWIGYISMMVFDANTLELERTVTPAAEWWNIPYSSAITYDSAAGKIYAINPNSIDGDFQLGVLNTQDGTFNKVASVDRAYLTLACSPAGQLYAVSDEGNLYTIDNTTGASTFIGATGRHPQYSQSMSFDLNTGALYWAFMNGESSALCQIDTTTGRAYEIAPFSNHEEFVGLYVKAEAKADGVPAQATGLTFVNERGSLTGKLTATAPATSVDGQQLAIAGLKANLRCGDDLIQTLDVQPGQTFESQEFTLPQSGVYTFSVEMENAAGAGARTVTTGYVGADTPMAPQNAHATLAGNTVTVTWEAPAGVNGGFIDTPAMRYVVTRYDKEGNGTEILTTEAGATSCTDLIPEGLANEYFYTIQAVVGSTTYDAASTNHVYGAGYFELPFDGNFSDGDRVAAYYTFLDVDGDGHDNRCEWFWKEDERLVQYCTDNEHVGNDWFFSPAIHLDGKNIYNLRFSVNMGGWSNLRVTYGKTTDPADQIEIADFPGMWDSWQTDKYADFCVPEDGKYYIGFYNYTGVDGSYFNLFNFAITAGMAADTPRQATDMTVTPGQQGALQAQVSFTAPATYVNNQPLPQALTARIERGGAEVAKLSCTPGQEVAWTDNAPVQGVNEYAVYIIDDQGHESQPTKASAYVGVDTPRNVNNLKLTTTDNNCTVVATWDAPTEGVNGGYLDPSALTYDIYCSYDGQNWRVLAEGVTETTYSDSELAKDLDGKQDAYYYGVVAQSQGGTSELKARIVSIGTPLAFPVSESFPNGQFDINPWLTESLQGYFSWSTLRGHDEDVYPQDNDGGFIRFYNEWGGDCDSRLITPVVSLDGSEHPMLSLYMFHWEENSVASDNKATKLVIDVAPDGGDWDEPIAEVTAAWPTYGWVEHRFSLEKYKDSKYLRIGLRGQTDNYWMFYYVDNIRFDEQYERDLAISEFYGYAPLAVNDDAYFTVNYHNRGTETVSDYDINLYCNNKMVATAKGEALEPGQQASANLVYVLPATLAGRECKFRAEIAYPGDQNQDDNVSSDWKATVSSTNYPCPQNLTAADGAEGVELAWDAPALPTTDEVTTDGAEDYEPFAISDFGDWKSIDNDGHGSGYDNSLPWNVNAGVDKAFQVWSLTALGVDPADFPNYAPRTGDNCFICWYANISYDWDTPYNDDYLISPEVKGGTDVTFYIRRANPTEEQETYQIMYSTTTPEPDQMQFIANYNAGADWEAVTFTLPEDARYFAIHYTASLQTAILVDDISYVDAICALQLQGYNVFRDGERINAETVAEPAYVDSAAPQGSHYYQVSAVYDRGESCASDGVRVVSTGIADILGAGNSFTVYSIDGRLLGRGLKTLNGLEPGIYIVNHQKVLIR